MYEVPLNGHLILIVGPSGSGKGSLISYIREVFPQMPFAISCTTRDPRPGEKDGEVYHFTSENEFRQRIDEEKFLEWASYGGHLYGTLKSEIVERMERGEVVLREVEVQGARTLKQLLPKENLTVIFIDAGSWEEMVVRIKARAPMSEEALIKRHERYIDERTFLKEADFVIDNRQGMFEEAKQKVAEIVRGVIDRVGPHSA